MKLSITTALVAAAFALAACDRPVNPTTSRSAATGGTQAPKDTSAVQTPNTPANLPKPSEAEKAESSNPQQGQVDPKQPEPRRDFQRR